MNSDVNLSGASESISKIIQSSQLLSDLIASDIIEAILDGKQSRDLKLRDLMRGEIPDVW